MRLTGSFLLLFLYVCFFCSCAHNEKIIPRDIASLQATGGMEGIWFLQGTSSTRGPYNGELELRRSTDGTYDVVRAVTYINYFFDGLKVQEIWTGKGLAVDNSLVVTYDLRQADFISKLGDNKRQPSDFLNPIAVIERFEVNSVGLSAKFSDEKVSKYSEWITTKRALEAKPIWFNERGVSESRGPGGEKVYIFSDPTDYIFYQNNKDIIRVVNKVVDEVSTSEAVIRRNAYALSPSQKAEWCEREGRNLNSKNQAPSDLGIYLASQAMRYEVTKSQEALGNVYQALGSLRASTPANEDELRELVHGLAWAALVVPKSDSKTWTELVAKSKELRQSKPVSSSLALDRTLLGISALETKDPGLKAQYESSYKESRSSYKKNQLNAANVNSWLTSKVTEILIADQLGSETLRDRFREELMTGWTLFEPKQGNTMTWLAYGFAYRHGARGSAFNSLSSDARFKEMLVKNVWKLREASYPLSNAEIVVDQSLRSEWAQYLKGGRIKGMVSFPAFETPSSSGPRSVFDYLYAYWLSRYVGASENE